MRQSVRVVVALQRRSLNEILRVPGGAVPGVLAPTIFLIGLSGVFGAAAQLEGFSGDFKSFIVPVGLLQGASFTGAATGVNLARDIEQGWFDRMLLAPVSRTTLLIGVVASAALRSLLPGIFLLAVGFSIGVDWPGVLELAIATVLVSGMAAAVACWATALALKFRTQQAAPLMQIGGFVAVLFTTAYAPAPLLSDWLRTLAELNPVTRVIEGIRQGFVGDVTWATTWRAFAPMIFLQVVLGLVALRGTRRADG
ncbi:MAG: ABC transporter permease [Solirubrobacteraceae bacterium]